MVEKRRKLKSRRKLIWASVSVVLLACFAGLRAGELAASEANLWKALKSGGHVALLRHAIAPGTGDPDEFTIGKCSTQRNLSEQGRAQATRIGRRFRTHGVKMARVYSSQWCRCRDTAELLRLGFVAELPILNSFFRQRERQKSQTLALREWLKKQNLSVVRTFGTDCGVN